MDLTALFLNLAPKPVESPLSREDSNSSLPGRVQTRPVRRMNRLTDAKILDLVASYLRGTTITELAAEFEINPTTVQAHLRRQKVGHRPYRKVRPEQVAEAVQLHAAGMSVRGVARHLGVAQDTAKRLLVEAGAIPPPPNS